MRWSFSASRSFSRCPRQFYYGQIAAYHAAKKDPLRREAFLLKQRKSLPLWRGNLVHDAIENLVVPAWRHRQSPDWDWIVESMHETAARQLKFSASGRYREAGMTKTKAGDAYCALVGHGPDETLQDSAIDAALEEAERALRNLADMSDLHDQIAAAPRPLFAEVRVPVNYDGMSISAQIDLLYFRQFAHPTIVEWKTYEGTVGNSELQGALYAWALQNNPKWRVESPEAVEILEVQLLKSAVIPAPGQFRLPDRLWKTRFIAVFVTFARWPVMESTRDVDIADFPIAQNPRNCQYCQFQSLCADRLHAANDDSTKSYPLAANG